MHRDRDAEGVVESDQPAGLAVAPQLRTTIWAAANGDDPCWHPALSDRHHGALRSHGG